MRRQSGFTIVELLIVIVVIGILAAIVIVAYNGVQSRANDTAVQADLHSNVEKLEMYRTDNGTYPTGATWDVIEPALQTAKLSFSKGSYVSLSTESNIVYLNTNSGTDFAIVAKSKSNKVFCYGSKIGTIQDCTSTGGANGFPASGTAPYRTLLGMDGSYATWGWVNNAWSSWAK